MEFNRREASVVLGRQASPPEHVEKEEVRRVYIPILQRARYRCISSHYDDSDEEDDLNYFSGRVANLSQMFTEQSYLRLLPLIKEALENMSPPFEIEKKDMNGSYLVKKIIDEGKMMKGKEH